MITQREAWTKFWLPGVVTGFYLSLAVARLAVAQPPWWRKIVRRWRRLTTDLEAVR